ncbi:MAG: hypothetical protein ACPLRA_02845, partial [Candidatus Saccharicenans sp.]
GKDFQSEELTDGGITLINETERTRILEASLIAGGQGLKINSRSEKVELVGSLATTALIPASTNLNIFHLSEQISGVSPEADYLIYSEKPLLYLSDLRILEWRPAK